MFSPWSYKHHRNPFWAIFAFSLLVEKWINSETEDDLRQIGFRVRADFFHGFVRGRQVWPGVPQFLLQLQPRKDKVWPPTSPRKRLTATKTNTNWDVRLCVGNALLATSKNSTKEWKKNWICSKRKWKAVVATRRRKWSSLPKNVSSLQDFLERKTLKKCFYTTIYCFQADAQLSVEAASPQLVEDQLVEGVLEPEHLLDGKVDKKYRDMFQGSCSITARPPQRAAGEEIPYVNLTISETMKLSKVEVMPRVYPGDVDSPLYSIKTLEVKACDGAEDCTDCPIADPDSITPDTDWVLFKCPEVVANRIVLTSKPDYFVIACEVTASGFAPIHWCSFHLFWNVEVIIFRNSVWFIIFRFSMMKFGMRWKRFQLLQFWKQTKCCSSIFTLISWLSWVLDGISTLWRYIWRLIKQIRCEVIWWCHWSLLAEKNLMVISLSLFVRSPKSHVQHFIFLRTLHFEISLLPTLSKFSETFSTFLWNLSHDVDYFSLPWRLPSQMAP